MGGRTLARDESVRKFGLVTAIVGLLAVAAIIVSGQFFAVGLFDPTVQGGSMLLGVYFLISAIFFGQQWKTKAPISKIEKRIYASPWLTGLLFLSTMMFVCVTWIMLYRVTDSMAAALALMGGQLLVVGWCYLQYRKALAANPAQVPS